MKRLLPRPLALTITAALVTCALFSALSAQSTEENFDSPTPILLTEKDSTRALVQSAKGDVVALPRVTGQAFRPGTRVNLYVSDLSLLPGEGANAFRIYAEDGRGFKYRFPVSAIQIAGKNIWCLTVALKDEVGYYEPPAGDGDVLIYLTWRGLASNRVRLGLGRVGGGPKDPPDSKPAPVGTSRLKDAPAALPVAREADRMRFQEQAGFGPTAAWSASLSRLKLTRWIQNQFNASYPTFPYPNQPLKPGSAPADCDGDQTVTPDVPATCFRDTYTMYPIQTWNSQEMLYGDDQLRHKVTWALSQIWVTSGNDIQQSRHMVEWHKILSKNAFANYRTLMREMTLSPTMGDYLSMNLSTRTSPNENYAREIMQLFTIGLFMLNQDGTVRCVEHNPCQAGDTQVPTYDQNTVNNLTKVFTGWNFCSVATNPACPSAAQFQGSPNYIDPMLLNNGSTNLNNNRHDLTAKTLLQYPNAVGASIPACTNCTTMANVSTYAYASLDQALDNIFYHPNLGPYVSKTLIQQMVTSDPSPAYVGRVAAAFNDNGMGVRGDMKAVVSAILLDPEARGNVKTDPTYGKLREPVSFAANFLRAMNVKDAAGVGQSDGVLTGRGEYTGMGQNPFRSPTVFNYYPPSFIVPGTALLGPEFALMTTGTTVQRTNFINLMTFNVIPVTAANNNGGQPNGTSITLSDLQSISAADPTGNALLDELNKRLMHGTMSQAMKTTIINALAPTAAGDVGRVRQAVYLVATSSQYQVQR